MRLVRWIEMKLAPNAGQVLRFRPGAWNPEPSLDTTQITLHHAGFPKWKSLDRVTYNTYRKVDLPSHWTVVEKRWHPDARQVFIRIVSMGDERTPVVGWCQYLYEHFDWIDLKDVDKQKP